METSPEWWHWLLMIPAWFIGMWILSKRYGWDKQRRYRKYTKWQ